MKFNQYIWELFINSDKGKDLIKLFNNTSNNLSKLQKLQKSITDEIFYYTDTVVFSKIQIENGFNKRDLIDKFGSAKRFLSR